ncbi:MAG: hypothetical protein JO031_15100 [Ktedonobacteraceae bacterium]|nr:hypothetical protein [Ktedonobacteraceae bacterium]
MQQMNPEQPIREGYGGYEGNQSYAPPPPPQYSQEPQNSAYDDEYIDSLAQRLSQRMAQGPRGKIQSTAKDKVSPGMRLTLAIISIVVLIPLAGILMGGVGGLAGLISFGSACLAIFLINAVFSDHH